MTRRNRKWRHKGVLTEDAMALLALSKSSNADLERAFPGMKASSLRRAIKEIDVAVGTNDVLQRSRTLDEMLIAVDGKTGVETAADGLIVINWDDGVCLTDLGKSHGGNVKTTFEMHNAIQREYSDHYGGHGKTMKEIQREFGFVTVAHVRKYLRAWSIYHSSTPQSYLELSTANEEDLESFADENVASVEKAVFERTIKKQWSRTVADAAKYRELSLKILQPAFIGLEESYRTYEVPHLEMLGEPASPFVAVIGLSDVHFNKVAFGPDDEITYDVEIAERELESTLVETLQEFKLQGRPEFFVVTMGTDNFHTDNLDGSTTAGTPQDIDLPVDVAIPRYIVAMVRYIDTLRQVAPVKAIVTPGNHDRMVSMVLATALKLRYDDSDDVEIIAPNNPRTYIQVGNYCLGFTHGDPEFRSKSLQKTNVHKLVLTEARAQGVKLDEVMHTWFFGGNLHFEDTTDFGGVTYEQFVAFCGDDRWHKRGVFIGARKLLATYIIDLKKGMTKKLYANAELGTGGDNDE